MRRDETRGAWRRLGSPPPGDLLDARLQMHWAVQPLAAVGHMLIPFVDDWSHTSMDWLVAQGLFTSQPLSDGRRLALDPARMTLHVLAAGGQAGVALALHGRTLAAAMAWAAERLAPGRTLARPDYDMPEHPVGTGARFECGEAGSQDGTDPFAELGRWYAGAAHLLTPAAARPEASPLRCWPHHFDLATLLRFDPPGADPESARTVGLGLSPGDETFPEPYFYALPWPPPAGKPLPPLAGGGRWETEAWLGGVLPGSALVKAGDALGVAAGGDQALAAGNAQEAAARAFLESALEAGRRLLQV